MNQYSRSAYNLKKIFHYKQKNSNGMEVVASPKKHGDVSGKQIRNSIWVNGVSKVI